jgi:hypothetical protein
MSIKILPASASPSLESVTPAPAQTPTKGKRSKVPKLSDPGIKPLSAIIGTKAKGLDSATTAVEKMLARGEISQRPEGWAVDTSDPDLREDFGRLVYVGADAATICRILRINRSTYLNMKTAHVERAIDSLADVGVIGMVALSFDKMEEASRQALSMAANLDGVDCAQNKLAALRLVKDIEAEKINLLVKTGAIKVKKKVEISGNLVQTGTDLDGGEKAQRVMLDIMALIEAGEEETEAEVAPPENPMVEIV